jgi:hypothetical protein
MSDFIEEEPVVEWDTENQGSSNPVNDQVVPFLAGAGNQALFGLPEAVVRKISGDKQVDDFVNKYKSAYKTGEVAGTIGSSFIPVAGIAGKGLQAVKFLKPAVKLGKSLEKIGSAKSGAALIGRGLTEGAIGEGVRQTVSPDDDPLSHVISSAVMGGAGGAIGAGLSKLGLGLEEATKDSSLAVIGTALEVSPRMFRQFLKGQDNSSWINKLTKEDDQIKELAKIVSGKNLAGVSLIPKIGKDDKVNEWSAVVLKKLQDLDKAYQAAPSKIDTNLLTSFDDIAKKVSTDYHGQMSLSGKVIDGPEFLKQIKTALSPVMREGGLVGKRVMLNKIINRSKGGLQSGNYEQAAIYDAALDLKRALNRESQAFAESLGDPSYAQAIREYGVLENVVAPAVWRSESALPSMSGGSPTAEKIATQMAMGKIASGSDVGQIIGEAAGGNIIGRAINTVLPYLQNRVAASANKSLHKASESDALANVIQKIEKASNVSSPQISRSMAAAVPAVQKGSEIENLDQAEALEDEAMLNEVAFNQDLARGIEENWFLQTGGELGEADINNPDFAEFVQGIMAGLTNNGETEIDKKLAANILFQDKTERDKYLKLLESENMIAKNIDLAQSTVPVKGIPVISKISEYSKNILNPSESAGMARQKIGSVVRGAAKTAGIDEGKALAALDSILSSTGSAEMKRKKIIDILKSYSDSGG